MEECRLKASLGYVDMSQKQTNPGVGLYTCNPRVGEAEARGLYESGDQARVFMLSSGPLNDEQALKVQNGHMPRAGESHRTKLRRDCRGLVRWFWSSDLTNCQFLAPIQRLICD